MVEHALGKGEVTGPIPVVGSMGAVKKGIYQHFKGNLYEVIGLAKNSENLEEEWVVYRPLYKSEIVTDLCIRPKKMFLETVERDGKKMKRFKFIKEK